MTGSMAYIFKIMHFIVLKVAMAHLHATMQYYCTIVQPQI